MKTVYFAGKVTYQGGYRGELLGDTRVMSNGYRKYKISGGFVFYGGPFALSCDHGCFHREGSHGLLQGEGDCLGFAEDLTEGELHGGCFGGISRQEAVSRCLDQINQADAVHCFLDSVTAYGTMVELGFANAMAKPIYIYYEEKAHNWKKHLWFCMNLPNVRCCEPGSKTSFHPDLLKPQKTYKERYHEYLQSNQWKYLRKAKLKEADHRCQLCNAKSKLNVHHRTYDRVFNERLGDLIALCPACHEKFHGVEHVA